MADFPQAQNLNSLLTGALRDPAQLQKEQLMSWLADKQKEQATIEKGGGGFIQGLAPVVEGLDAMSGGLPGWLLGHGLNALDYATSKLPQSRENMTDQKALIPTKANLAKFLELMTSANLKASKKDFPTHALAEAFTAARYPKRYQKVAQALEVRKPGLFESMTAGSYNPETRTTALLAHRGNKIDSLTPSDVKDNVATLVHEGQHAIDHQRLGSSVKPEEFIHTSKGGKYINGMTDPEGYRNQNVEKRAFAAGKTGAESLDNLLELLPTPKSANSTKIEPRSPSIPASNTGIYKEWVNSAFNKAIREARKTISPDKLPAVKAEIKKARAKKFEDINWWDSHPSLGKDRYYGQYFEPKDTYPHLLGIGAKAPWSEINKFAARVKPDEVVRHGAAPETAKIQALMEMLNISASPRDNFFGVSRGKTKTAGR